MTLILLAAGLGSRYGGLKQIEPLGPHGETLMDYSIYDAQRAGFDRVIFIIRRDFEAAFRDTISSKYQSRLAIEHAFQSMDDVPHPFIKHAPARQKPWGTTHALLAARHIIKKDPFVVINADDFYGLESFQNHAKFFETQIPKSPNPQIPKFAMAGYRLRNTLSPHGTVARGVCRASATNQLLSIREHTKIRALENGAAEDIADPSAPVAFTGDEPVSLNNWAFTPAVMDLLVQYFCAWLCQNEGDPAKECYLPTAVGHFITKNQATCSILPCSAPWFGVTYKDDVPGVKSRLAALHAEGVYPEKLW